MPGPPSAWAVAVAGGWSVVRLLRLGRDVDRARRMAARVDAFQRVLDDDGPALLVAGDSLAVGVGASHPSRSVVGRLAAACPGLTVVTVARSGARLVDLPAQLEAAPVRRWDAVLLTGGGNDALQRTPRDTLARDADRALAAARMLAPIRVVATSANLGGVPIVPWPLTRWLEHRSRRARDVLRAACAVHDAQLVDFFRPLAQDPFARDPGRWFGPDGVHPSDASYALCAAVIERRTGLVRRLAARR